MRNDFQWKEGYDMIEMKERLRRRVAELTAIIGVSGYEWDLSLIHI